ncbi:Wadjet anti-phage system protein JetD domain-containing protein [Methylobacter sp. Wu1]|uniref:Wadjet anti-phage system protein JetD domain-containing protein n=1 Tax=Methylobacter sp. Wu1 TaxID=3119359 RepID=UPI002F955A06
MTWTRPADLRAQVRKLWDRGELLGDLVTGGSLFPKRLVLKSPTSAEMADRFDDVRAWIAELRAMPYCRVEMREFRHRIFGTNAVPQEAWIDTVEDAAALIGKRKDAARFTTLVDMTRKREPKLLDWLARRPLRALELADEWELLLAIVAWLENHQRPEVYLRQVDIPGVHSKFIEAHRGVLMELLDLVLPPEAIDQTASGVSQFARRYGFRDKPARIRFRVLDPEHSLLGLAQDITLDAESFARLDLPVARVFITENEINFLAFPRVKNSLAIFGAGYGFEMLARAEWLSRCRIHYWGDIDTHGFAILDQLRGLFCHAESILMDRDTLQTFEPLWGEEGKQTLRDLSRLNPEEAALYDDLRDNRIRKNLRLEQEAISFGYVESALSALT